MTAGPGAIIAYAHPDFAALNPGYELYELIPKYFFRKTTPCKGADCSGDGLATAADRADPRVCFRFAAGDFAAGDAG